MLKNGEIQGYLLRYIIIIITIIVKLFEYNCRCLKTR